MSATKQLRNFTVARHARWMIRLRGLLGMAATVLLAMSADAATFTVNSAADSGGSCPGATCTLRQAIATAVSGDTINFASSITTIDLTSGELLIDKSLMFSGPGANLLTVRRSAAPGTLEFHIFHVPAFMVVTISGMAIRNGATPSQTNGGAVYNGGTLTISGCTLSDNVSSNGGGSGGGAIFNNGGSNPRSVLNITNSTISGNSTIGGILGGGGIMDGGGGVTITNSTISGNSSGNKDGGGINSLGTLTITNSTISGNSAGSGTGGGIDTFGRLSLTNCTIAGNSAGNGGGIRGHQGGTSFTSTNTIVATNTAPVAPDVSGTVYSLGYNLFGNTSGATINGPTGGNQLNADPLLGPLQDNGGPTWTHALLTGSPAIDKGHSRGSVTDQRGFTRPVGTANAPGGDGSDIGAFEVGGTVAPTPTPGPTATPPSSLGNISTRVRVLEGDNALIGGMITTGTGGKRVIIRAIGPSLSNFGVPGALANPTLDFYLGSTLLFSNDDWNNSTQQAEIAGSGLAPGNDLEAAIIWTLEAGQSYTAVVRGLNGTTGIGVVEVFDLSQATFSKLGNISTRGFVDVDDNVMIAGLIVAPSNGTNLKVLVRALGPTLSDFGVPGALANPTLDLVNSSGTVIRSNDNWKDDSQQRSAIEAAGLAPSHDEEAALVETISPGSYTAIVRGASRATGVGLVEAYNIP